MKALSRLMNVMLGVWFAAILIMGIFVTAIAGNKQVGTLISGLFAKKEMTIPVSIPEVKKTAPPVEPEPAPVIKQETPPPPTEWTPLAIGTASGKGELKLLGSEILPDKKLQFSFAVNGELTQYTKNYQRSPKAVYVDFFGTWKASDFKQFYFKNGPARKVQMAMHKERGGFIRVSFLSQDDNVGIDANVEINNKDKKLRILVYQGK